MVQNKPGLTFKWIYKAKIGDRFNMQLQDRIITGVVSGFTPMATLHPSAGDSAGAASRNTSFPIIVCDNGGFPGKASENIYDAMDPIKSKLVATWTCYVVSPIVFEKNRALNLHLE